MGSGLHQILKSLCFNTEWSYAIFWKLKHRARMVLTWEDAYCDSCRDGNPSDKCFTETLDSLHDGNYSRYLLGLAVAKMSSHVYCLGEGIVGQVAVTGKHQWIILDGHGSNSCPSVEYGDGWLSQFSAGIRTIVVVAVVPHGVLQLGSLNKVSEDMKLVTRIRDLFFAFQGSSMVSNMIECDMKNLLCLPNLPKKSLTSEVSPDSLCSLDKAANVERANVWFPPLTYFAGQNDTSIVSPLPSICHSKAVEAVNKHGEPEISISGGDVSVTLLNPRSNIIKLEHQNRIGKELLNANNYEGESSGYKGMGLDSEYNILSHSNNCVMDNINVCNFIPQVDNFRVDPPSGLLDSTGCGEVKLVGADLPKNEVLHTNDSSNMKLEEGLEKREFQTEFGQLDTADPFLKFSAGCELFEALGPAFQKKSFDFNWEGEKVAAVTNVEIPEEMSSSKLTHDSGSEHLLEAVVASFCHNGSDVKSEKSFSKSVQSLLTTDNMPEPSSHTKNTVNSSGYSIDRPSLIEDGPRHCLNSSELSGVMSSKGFSSPCPSTCSEQFERSSGPSKNKKRARPGENSRPRPRDRQLIQDRIKELRELVPSGSKCSIDSLLERTIKHMLFLQSIAKHADKLNKCSDTKSRCKEIGVQGSSTYEQGSSWAVEVGSHLKVCSIIVENLNKNGQMLVEMLCEECSHFLEIAEAIRSLGLTILKGVTEARGDKTWICFVVEGQNNRSIHRMDILWSLVQILQPNTTV